MTVIKTPIHTVHSFRVAKPFGYTFNRAAEIGLEREENNVSDIIDSASPNPTREVWEGIARRCKFCREWFMPNTKNHKFCSKKCGYRFGKPKTVNSWLGTTGICEVCFQKYFRTGWHQRYCSRKCYALGQIACRRKIREKMKNEL